MRKIGTELFLLGVWVYVAALSAQMGRGSRMPLDTGKQIFQAACVGCHGPDGKGMPKTTLGFEPPETFPDFTRCDQTTVEPDSLWHSVIHGGGHARAFSEIMPSFGEALTGAQIDKVIGYLRSFCQERGWPRGELNLPRPLMTEKAFPEDETIITTAINAKGAPGIRNAIVYEKRLTMRNQVEVKVPVMFRHQDPGGWFGGVGDASMGLKRVLVFNGKTGSILSAQGEVVLPTGNRARGLGKGVAIFETFAAYGQLLPGRTFVQMQGGGELPTDPDKAAKAVFWRTAFGKSINQGGGMGRMWTPMFELVADRNIQTGAKTNWDVLPQFQVTLSRRQHVRFNVGLKIPANNTAGRATQVLFYLLWDRLDGALLEGWR